MGGERAHTRGVPLTSMPSCTASMATLASGSGSCWASRSARAPWAWPMCPKHTLATSSRCVFTHMRAMFSQTAWLRRRTWGSMSSRPPCQAMRGPGQAHGP